MSVYTMICGEMARPAERRTSKSGNDFVSALMKINNDGITEWWRVIVFEPSMKAELMSLQTGDILTAKGRFQGGHYKGQRRRGAVIADTFCRPNPPYAGASQKAETGPGQTRRSAAIQ